MQNVQQEKNLFFSAGIIKKKIPLSYLPLLSTELSSENCLYQLQELFLEHNSSLTTNAM